MCHECNFFNSTPLFKASHQESSGHPKQHALHAFRQEHCLDVALSLPLLMPSRSTIPWPDHWYNDQSSIKCLVHGCGFATQPNGLLKQFSEMKKHCADTPGIEHKIFLIILGQRNCAICSYRVKDSQTSSNRIRTLLFHEKSTHGSDFMSRTCEYIVLARKGRIDGRLGQESQKIIFDRMIEKLRGFEQPITHLLCQKAGLPHSLSNLRRILSTDCLRSDEDFAPDWRPVAAERFLWQLRPDGEDPADVQWGRVWKRLRQMYSNGHL